MTMQTYHIVSHITVAYQLADLDKNYYSSPLTIMRNDIARVLREWFGLSEDESLYVVMVQPGKLNIHGTFRFDSDILPIATQKLDELVFKAAENHGVEISGWISFVSKDVGYEMVDGWENIVNAYLYSM